MVRYCLEYSLTVGIVFFKPSSSFTKEARGGGIRTHDFYVPNVARYQAALHPANIAIVKLYLSFSKIKSLVFLLGSSIFRLIFFEFCVGCYGGGEVEYYYV